MTIGDVQPGPARAFVGETLTISALVRGLRKEEPVTLYFTTEDGQSVDQPLAMQPPSDSYRHQVVLPPWADCNRRSIIESPRATRKRGHSMSKCWPLRRS